MHGEKRMFASAFNTAVRRLSIVLFLTLLSLSLWGQDTQSGQPASSQPAAPQAVKAQQSVLKDYSKPQSHFPNPLSPYVSRHVAPPYLSNTARIDQLLQEGKLYLSMNDAVALALENNLDIAIQR